MDNFIKQTKRDIEQRKIGYEQAKEKYYAETKLVKINSNNNFHNQIYRFCLRCHREVEVYGTFKCKWTDKDEFISKDFKYCPFCGAYITNIDE